MSIFITNYDQKFSIKKRVEKLIHHSKELKFLVGFFYFSGWSELVDALRQREDLTIKILVGLDVDSWLDQTLEVALSAHGASDAELRDRFFASLGKALNNENLDFEQFYSQAEYFLGLLESGRLLIKKTREPNHAKLYFFKASEGVAGWLAPGQSGKFITGSSNLTRAGLHGQNEFNVEIGDYGTREAEEYFDQLWESAVDITTDPETRDHLLRVVRGQTQIAKVSPFEAYTLVLKTYLDLIEQKTMHKYVTQLLEESGYKTYQYQLDAVRQALGILEQYNGVIIADVVGLGKTLVACMIARDLGKRGMVICPPGLMGDEHYRSGWRKYLADFELRKYEWEVFSSGDLKGAAEFARQEGSEIEVVIIDEAHRFRNEDTESYEYLSAICKNRQVVLITATPFNNTPADIFAMLKLFLIPGRSPVTLDENLEARFMHYHREFQRLSFISRYHLAGGKKQTKAEKYYQELFDLPLPINVEAVVGRTRLLASQIRAVLEPVLIRRNRIDLKRDPVYSREIGDLPEVKDPCELFFELTPEQSRFYDRVVHEYFGEGGRFRGAIYQPFKYEKPIELDVESLSMEENRAYWQQSNLYDFMRRLLVKRFESSFGSFAQSIANFARVHQIVLDFIKASNGRYILDRQLIEKVYQEDPEEIEAELEAFAQRLSREKHIPRHERVYNIKDFCLGDKFISDIQSDLALMHTIQHELEELELVEHDSKAERLIAQLRELLNSSPRPHKPKRKVVVFSEYVDTVKHLHPLLEAVFPGRVFVSDGSLTPRQFEGIRYNFDASLEEEKQRDDYDILLTSDKLSEGINLHRAGAVINYDIPWNPTRVIQRVGRINRIGKKVFDELYIYNFFPTEQGADVIKSREIASQKMFLIHSTLGEDAKIFAADETPAPAELYRRINLNPEEGEEESLFTAIRSKYFEICEAHPEVIKRIAQYPARVKTAKAAPANQLVVVHRKALGLFVHMVDNTYARKLEVTPKLLGESLPLIECTPDEPRLMLSGKFWQTYEAVKSYREVLSIPMNANALEVKAQNNLKSAIANYPEELGEWVPFIRMLIKDLRNYRTLSKYTLRRLTSVEMDSGHPQRVKEFTKELKVVRQMLGEDYLDVIEKRVAKLKSEVIIAVENQAVTSSGENLAEEEIYP